MEHVQSKTRQIHTWLNREVWYRVDAPPFYENYCWIGIPDSVYTLQSVHRKKHAAEHTYMYYKSDYTTAEQ